MITNGTCVNITDAGALAKIVLGAALEEQAQNKLAKLILPLYQDILKRHEIGRFEQHVHQIYHKLKAAKVKVHTSMGVTEYPEHAEHQIDCITYCTDLKQAKAMARSEYFMDFDTTVNFSAAHTALVTEGQVRSCLKRIKDKAAEILFHQQGCSFRTEKWQAKAFDERWSEYQVQGARKKLKEPWCVVREDELRRYRKVLEEAGKIASGKIKLSSDARPVRGRKNPIKTTGTHKWGQKRAAPQRAAWGQRRATPQQAPVQQQARATPVQQAPQQVVQPVQPQRSAPAQPQAASRPAPRQQQQRSVPQQRAPVQPAWRQRQPPAPQQQQRPAPSQQAVQQQQTAWGQRQATPQQAPMQHQAPVQQTPPRRRQSPVQQQQADQGYVPPHRRS